MNWHQRFSLKSKGTTFPLSVYGRNRVVDAAGIPGEQSYVPNVVKEIESLLTCLDDRF
jgi:hypothetical protein